MLHSKLSDNKGEIDLAVGAGTIPLITDSAGLRTGRESQTDEALQEIPQSPYYEDALGNDALGTCLSVMESGGQLLKEGVPRPCHVCGQGFYQPQVLLEGKSNGLLRFWFPGMSDLGHLSVQPFACDKCGHIQFFKA